MEKGGLLNMVGASDMIDCFAYALLDDEVEKKLCNPENYDIINKFINSFEVDLALRLFQTCEKNFLSHLDLSIKNSDLIGNLPDHPLCIFRGGLQKALTPEFLLRQKHVLAIPRSQDSPLSTRSNSSPIARNNSFTQEFGGKDKNEKECCIIS